MLTGAWHDWRYFMHSGFTHVEETFKFIEMESPCNMSEQVSNLLIIQMNGV